MERPPTALAAIKTNRAQLGVGAQFLYEMMGRHFSWEDVRYTAPTRTFSGRLDLKVGDKDVQLIYAGPRTLRATRWCGWTRRFSLAI